MEAAVYRHKERLKEDKTDMMQDIHQQRAESKTARGIAASNTRSSSAWQEYTERVERREKEENGGR